MAKPSLPKIPWDKIGGLSRTHRILICAGVFLILAGSFVYLIYLPRSSEINELKGKYEELDAKLIQARNAAREKDKFEKEYKEAEGGFKLALRVLPNQKEIPTLLEDISRSGKDSGLEFILFKPRAEAPKDFYAEIPVDIQVTGGYHNLAIFFDRVARLHRLVNIMDIKITSGAAGKGGSAADEMLSASCVAMTYMFLEGAEKKAPGGK